AASPTVTSLLLVIALVCFVASAVFLATGLAILRRGRWLSGATTGLLGSLFLAAGALAAMVTIGVQGYRALTLETVAATVSTEPVACSGSGPRSVCPTSGS